MDDVVAAGSVQAQGDSRHSRGSDVSGHPCVFRT